MAEVLPFEGRHPRIASDAFVAPTAVIVGNVQVKSRASVWFGAVLRGDDPDHPIVVGPGSNVQDNALIHVTSRAPTLLGRDVTVGHGVSLESCRIGDGTLIGMNAVVLPEAEVGEECLIAAGAVVLEGTRIPDRSLVAGVPAKVRRTVDASAGAGLRRSASHYVNLSRRYLEQGVGTLER